MPTPAIALCIILARGGSKGVTRKNMAAVGGKPCLQWTIDTARAARGVARIALSSDDDEMLSLARAAGLTAVERPRELATDTARVDDAARHAVKALTETRAQARASAPAAVAGPPDSTPIVILYGNVPIRPPRLIDRALDLMARTHCDSVQSYSPVGKYHPWWIARVNDNPGPTEGKVAPWEGDVLNHGVYRRQDLPPAYIPDGGVLIVTRRALFGDIPGVPEGPHAFFGLDRRGILNPEGSVIDIDSKEDLLVADAILNERRGGGGIMTA